MDQELLVVADLNNLGHQWAVVVVVAVDMVVLHKQHMVCHLKIIITTLNKTTIPNKSNNSSIKTQDNQCQNIEIKATWNTKLQRGTKINIAKRTVLKTS